MKEDQPIPEFSLFGGPLQGLGCRLGLIRGGTNTVPFGVALGLLAWGVLMGLGLMQGFGLKMFTVGLIGLHVRLLVFIPLALVCEAWVFPQMASFVHGIVRSGLVPEAELPALKATIGRARRINDSWLAEALLLLAAFTLPLVPSIASLQGATANWESVLGLGGGRPTLAHVWYLAFCLPLFRFLMFRWLLRLGLWTYLLLRLRKLKLNLIAIHSDGAAGLGRLGVVHEHFAPLAFAISAVLSARFAEDISAGTMTFESLYPSVMMILLGAALLFIGPLCLFASNLWTCRIAGLGAYMGMASRYVNAFDRKWIQGDNPSGQQLLGTPDMQSLADLTNSVKVVREMRWIPAGPRLFMVLGTAVAVPMLPLLMLKYPVEELMARLFRMLTGL